MSSADIEKLARLLCQQDEGNPDNWRSHEAKAAGVIEELNTLQEKIGEPLPDADQICADTAEYIDLCVGSTAWRMSDGRWILEDDYRVSGEVWRVHKGDADPYPSKPHAHCIGGAKRFVGCKLHLGTAQLYKGRDPLGRFLAPAQFARLIALIRPKFPGLTLPLPPSL